MIPELSIVIPTHAEGRSGFARRIARIDRLALSLLAQVGAPGWEALVVANAPDPELRSHITALDPRFHYLETGVVGANVARNAGLAAARGEWVLFLDDDCVAASVDFLRRHAELHRAHGSTLGFGGPYRLSGGESRIAVAYHRKQMEWLHDGPRPSALFDWLPGGNASFKREALLAYGFNPCLVFGATETELQLRVAADGRTGRLVEELAVIHSTGRMSGLSYLRKAFAQGAGGQWILSQGLSPRALPPPRSEKRDAGFLAFAYEAGFHAGARWYRARGARQVGRGPLRMPPQGVVGAWAGIELLRRGVEHGLLAPRTRTIALLKAVVALGGS